MLSGRRPSTTKIATRRSGDAGVCPAPEKTRTAATITVRRIIIEPRIVADRSVLFGPQRANRQDLRGAPGRQPAGQKPGRNEDDRGGRKRNRVRGDNAKQQPEG